MDNDRFDALTRVFSRRGGSRRQLLRRAGAAMGAGLFGGALVRAMPAAADHCDYIGCGCSTGVLHACGNDLVCCASSPGTPGGAGVCAPATECGGQCVYWGDGCPAYCNWGDSCPDCCSGYCGNLGQCAQYGY